MFYMCAFVYFCIHNNNEGSSKKIYICHRHIRIGKSSTKIAFLLLNDSLLCSRLIKTRPVKIACACISCAVEINRDNIREILTEDWFREFDISLEDILTVRELLIEVQVGLTS